jgi:hypothetical protein
MSTFEMKEGSPVEANESGNVPRWRNYLCYLIGKLDVLYVHCSKCSRAGRYRVQHLIEERGRNARLIDWLDELTADCPKKQAHNMNDPCGARFPDLPKVL